MTLRWDRETRSGGWLAILFKSPEIKFSEIALDRNVPPKSFTEEQAAEIFLSDQSLSITNVYHPDNTCIDTAFIERLTSMSTDTTIVLGDFNAKSCTRSSEQPDRKGSQVEDLLNDLELTTLKNGQNTYLSRSYDTESDTVLST